MKLLKEYQAEGRAVGLMERALPVLEGIQKKWDVDDNDLDALRGLRIDSYLIIAGYCGAGDPGPTGGVSVVDRLRSSVLLPITDLGYLPTGGEQHGNMLCVESEIYRMNNYLIHYAAKA